MKIINRIITLAAILAGMGSLSAQTPSLVKTEAQKRKILIEEFTGINCQFCPLGHLSANNVVAKFPEQAFVINYHQGGYANTTPDLRTPFGDALFNQTGASGYPSGTINRHIFSGTKLDVPYNTWGSQAPKMLEMDSYVNVGASATLDWKTRTIKVDVELYYTADPGVASNFLNVALLQDNILGPQVGSAQNPAQVVGSQYRHMHALRHLLTEQWGDEITEIEVGKLIKRSYTYNIPSNIKNVDVVLEDISILVFVNESRKETMNVAHPAITNVNSPDYIVHILEASQIENTECGENVSTTVRLKNKSSKDITNITFEITTSKETQTIDVPVSDFKSDAEKVFTLPAFATVLNSKEEVEIKIVKINGVDYDNKNFVSTKLTVEKWGGRSSDKEMTLKLMQDKYGDETTWTLTKDGVKLAEGGPYRTLEQNGTRLNTETLPTATTGCYILKVFDSQGDGINNGVGEGSVSVMDSRDDRLIVKHNGKFGKEIAIYLDQSEVANESKDTYSYGLYVSPNPVSGKEVKVSFSSNKAQEFVINVFDLSGRSMINPVSYRAEMGANELTIPVTELKTGLYMLSLQSKSGKSATTKIIIK